MILNTFFTSPVGAVAKYCDEYVCVCAGVSVCLSVRISPEQHARSLPNFLCMLPLAVARSSSGRLTKSRGKLTFFGGVLNHWECIAVCTAQHLGPTQTRLNRSTCCLKRWVGLAGGTVCYMAVTIREGEGAVLGENMCPTTLTPLWIANRTCPCRGVYTIGAYAWLQVMDESIIGREGGGTGHLGRSLIYTIVLFGVVFYPFAVSGVIYFSQFVHQIWSAERRSS